METKASLYATRLLLATLVACMAASCADNLPEQTGIETSPDGMAFGISVVEQGDLLYEYGRTRAASGLGPDSATVAANTFASHPLEGGETQGLQVHRMPLPIMGIHPRSVGEGNHPGGTEATRASIKDIVSDANSFHDSLTIWGYTDKGRTLFPQILLKKIRGWRSSVHWPYDKLLSDQDKENPQYMCFYAIAPAMESLEDLTITNQPAYGTPPTFSYRVPDDPSAQRDLLLGESEKISITDGPPGKNGDQKGHYEESGSTEKEQHLGEDDKTVQLTFRHLLTAIRFAQGNMPVGITIQQIHLDNIVKEGQYTGSAWESEASATASYTIHPDRKIQAYAPENAYIDGDSVLFLMPQTLGENARLQLVIRKEGETNTRTLSCSLKDDIWKPGYTVTYKVTIGEVKGDYYLLVDPRNDYTADATTAPKHDATDTETAYTTGGYKTHDFNDGLTGSVIIHSFLNYKDYSADKDGKNVHKAAPWSISGFSWTKDGDYTTGNRPIWLKSITGWVNEGSGTGKANTVTPTDSKGEDKLTYELEAQSPAYQADHANILQNNVPKGSSDNYHDLSYREDTKTYETANCYIVNAAGFYSFPAHYGNGNITSEEAFIDHLGHTIKDKRILTQINNTFNDLKETDDFKGELTNEETNAGGKTKKEYTYTGYRSITESGGVAITQELIWEDVEGLFNVEESGFVNTSEKLRFSINSEKLQPGNGVIALKGYRSKITMTKVFDKNGNEIESLRKYTAVRLKETPDILWTWHIWVTDEVYPNNEETKVTLQNTVVDADKVTGLVTEKKVDEIYPSYKDGSKMVHLSNGHGILPVNLGWVPESMTFGIYLPRETWVEICQPNAPDNKIHLRIRQEAKQDLITGKSTVYQWGRPTALSMEKAEIFDYRKENGGEDGGVQDFIAYPTSLLYDKTTKASWWGSEKTIYDPCPPGFRLPDGEVFRVFSLTRDNLTNAADGDKLNLWDTNSAKEKYGAYLYATAHDTDGVPQTDRYGQIVYIPASGLYSGNVSTNGKMKDHYDYQSTAFSWTFGNNGTNGYGMQLIPYWGTSKSDVFLYNKTFRWATAMPIRPEAK